jgi:hypothetical protein
LFWQGLGIRDQGSGEERGFAAGCFLWVIKGIGGFDAVWSWSSSLDGAAALSSRIPGHLQLIAKKKVRGAAALLP